ncbi:MAG: alpha/beta hydrolase [Ornithinimicrobium sp.]
MARPRVVRQLVGSLAAFALVATPAAVQAAQTPTSASTATAAVSAKADTTSKKEAKRVDNVRTPKPDTFDCTDVFGFKSECGTVKLPLDYDKPTGAKTEVAYLRIPAKDQKNKTGTLFLNPGGPSGSGIDIASAAPFFLSPAVLKKFDIVGVDPRGVNFSDNVQCFKNIGEAASMTTGLNVAFPANVKQELAYKKSSKNVGLACSSNGKPLSAHMSTANVARDMDVMRRMFGDKQLSYLGFSYGSYLGTVYANLFPDRVRAVAIDGVLDPVAWAGTPATQRIPEGIRTRSGEGAQKATDEILRKCKKAGPSKCLFATKGDPQRNYAKIVKELKKNPLIFVDPDTGEEFTDLDYPTLIGYLLDDLYYPFAPDIVDSDLTFFYEVLFEEFEDGSDAAELHDEMARAFIAEYKDREKSATAETTRKAAQAKSLGFGFPYPNGLDAYYSVSCTDSLDPFYTGDWSTFAARADSTAPGFGPLWTWQGAPCAEKYWTVEDGDAYRGRFTAKTANPVLVVGNYWDPATNYDGAVAAASLSTNSRLLSSDNFGHTAYGTSSCVTRAMDTYLLTSKVPRAGTVCRSEYPVFEDRRFADDGPSLKSVQPDEVREQAERALEEVTPNRDLPPVVPPTPGATARN